MNYASSQAYRRGALFLLASTVILIFCTAALLLHNYQLSHANQQILQDYMKGEQSRAEAASARAEAAAAKMLTFAKNDIYAASTQEPKAALAVNRSSVSVETPAEVETPAVEAKAVTSPAQRGGEVAGITTSTPAAIPTPVQRIAKTKLSPVQMEQAYVAKVKADLFRTGL